MIKRQDLVKKCRLFAGIGVDEITVLLSCLSAGERRYPKDTVVFPAGSPVTRAGIILSGMVTVVKDDYWGNRTIISRFGAGELFAEAFSFAGVTVLPFSVIAAEDTTILFIHYKKLITTCSSACSYHTALVANMLHILAEKNLLLTRKMEHITHRTTREKLLSYLSAEAARAGSGRFAIPFNRQELADYLSVDRSAMSTELGRLRDEGVLAFRKNLFELL
ncbi:MAG: Crp/Fnr family transcriptional regulator [Spirochaetales bacterium]|nr:Crp/Fnr family transcriptional regulator [Spirochaetales bacterium]